MFGFFIFFIIVAKIFVRFSGCSLASAFVIETTQRHSIWGLNENSFSFCHRKLGLGRERNTHEGVTHSMSKLCPKCFGYFGFQFYLILGSLRTTHSVDMWVKSKAFFLLFLHLKK